MIDANRLPFVALPGLTPDSLGNYLASLGLLRILARKWPSVRIAWRNDVLHMVGGPARFEDLLDELVNVAIHRRWTPYQRDWLDAQKRSTKAKSGAGFALWQSAAGEDVLEMIAAHIVPAARLAFNPLMGKGGSVGNRDLTDGWRRTIVALEGSAKEKRAALEDLLVGRPIRWLLDEAPLEPNATGSKKKKGSLNAACWFSDANKLYNSGQKPYREGRVSPWAMALACEGLVFWVGGASRRLGARSRAVGAFPFVTNAAAPSAAGEGGHDWAEVWAPMWTRPMTLPEVRALFQRGRAEVHGRGVLTPSAFATAIVRRGVDAGISEFRRFVLGQTTSANTFEPRFEGRFHLPSSMDTQAPSSKTHAAVSKALENVLGLVESLPRDTKKGKRWRFVGLRGPIEAALLRSAASPEDSGASCDLLDAIVGTLDRVDRNRGFRAKRVSWRPLPIKWLPALFVEEPPTAEARLALALVSGFPRSRPFALYRFGVDWKYSRFEHTDRPPARWVWGPGELPRVLSTVLIRRTLDWETAHKQVGSGEEPVRSLLPASCAHVTQWFEGVIDESLLSRWISRLALFDWRFVPHTVRSLALPPEDTTEVDGALCLFGLFQPLFDLRPVRSRWPNHDLLSPESGARTPGAARRLANLIRVGQIDSAVRFARSRYSMADAPLAKTDAPWRFDDPERLLVPILFPVYDKERLNLIQRWLRPRREKGETVYA